MIRVVFRILVGGGDAGQVLLHLPSIPLPHWTLGLRLLGPVTRDSLLAGLYDGLRLAAIVICVGSANALANPKRLLRSVPPALYEVGSALVVAVTVLPQLADSVRRVRAAQLLRGGETGRVERAAAPADPGAGGLPRALARAGRRHGHAGLRSDRRRHVARAAYHRGADAARARCRRASASTAASTRRPRPGSVVRCSVLGVAVSVVAVRASPAAAWPAPATAPTAGAGPSWSSPRRVSWSPRRAGGSHGTSSPSPIPRCRSHLTVSALALLAVVVALVGALCSPRPGGWCGVIELRGIGFGYDERPVLRDVDLTVDEGELVAGLGPHRRRQVHAARRGDRAGAAVLRRHAVR